jgi:PAS domain S-box-containing protein
LLKRAVADGAAAHEGPVAAGVASGGFDRGRSAEPGQPPGASHEQSSAPVPEDPRNPEASALRALPVAIYSSFRERERGETWISPGVEELTGFPPSRFTSGARFWVSRIHPDDRPQVARELMDLGKTRRSSMEYRFHCADGVYRWMADLIVLPPGLAMTFGMMQDMDRKKKDELATGDCREFLGLLVDGASHGVMVLDKDHNMLFMNPRFAARLGHVDGDWVKKQIKLRFHPGDSGTGGEAISRALEGIPGQCRVRIANKDDTWRHVRLFMSPLAWRGRKLVMCVAGDTSEEERTEQEQMAFIKKGVEELIRGAAAALAPGISGEEAMDRIRSRLGERGKALLETFVEEKGHD